jgi:hypothetical protein
LALARCLAEKGSGGVMADSADIARCAHCDAPFERRRTVHRFCCSEHRKRRERKPYDPPPVDPEQVRRMFDESRDPTEFVRDDDWHGRRSPRLWIGRTRSSGAADGSRSSARAGWVIGSLEVALVAVWCWWCCCWWRRCARVARQKRLLSFRGRGLPGSAPLALRSDARALRTTNAAHGAHSRCFSAKRRRVTRQSPCRSGSRVSRRRQWMPGRPAGRLETCMGDLLPTLYVGVVLLPRFRLAEVVARQRHPESACRRVHEGGVPRKGVQLRLNCGTGHRYS